MPYNFDRQQRRPLRLPRYDYAQPGTYFVTICAERRACVFGGVEGGELLLNDAGRMIEDWWLRLRSKYGIVMDEFVVMPNHLHGIIVIEHAERASSVDTGKATGQPHGAAPTRDGTTAPLGMMVGWFKAMTTNAYIRGVNERGWPAFHGRLWQRNYYEHIVRDDRSLATIREYIATNPARWPTDPENPSVAPPTV